MVRSLPKRGLHARDKPAIEHSSVFVQISFPSAELRADDGEQGVTVLVKLIERVIAVACLACDRPRARWGSSLQRGFQFGYPVLSDLRVLDILPRLRVGKFELLDALDYRLICWPESSCQMNR